MKYLPAMLFFINSNLVLACSPNKIPFNLLVLIDGKKVVRNDLLNKDFIKEYNKELWYCDTGGKFRLEEPGARSRGDGPSIAPFARARCPFLPLLFPCFGPRSCFIAFVLDIPNGL